MRPSVIVFGIFGAAVKLEFSKKGYFWWNYNVARTLLPYENMMFAENQGQRSIGSMGALLPGIGRAPFASQRKTLQNVMQEAYY